MTQDAVRFRTDTEPLLRSRLFDSDDICPVGPYDEDGTVEVELAGGLLTTFQRLAREQGTTPQAVFEAQIAGSEQLSADELRGRVVRARRRRDAAARKADELEVVTSRDADWRAASASEMRVVGSQALRNMARIARSANLPLPIDEDSDWDEVDLTRTVGLAAVWWRQVDGRSYAVCQVVGFRRGASDAEECVALYGSLPGAHVAMLLGLDRPAAPRENAEWAGAHSFEIVRRLARERAAGRRVDWSAEPPADDAAEASMLEVSAALSLPHLERAHVLAISPEQVHAMPAWESPRELWDFAERVGLPFDPLYMDFTDAAGAAVTVELAPGGERRFALLRGCLLWRRAAGGLQVAPVGLYDEHPERAPMERPDAARWGWSIPGAVVFERAADESDDGELGRWRLALGDGAATFTTVPLASVVPDAPGGTVDIFPAEQFSAAVERDGLPEQASAAWWALMVVGMAESALSALSLLEASEVELVECDDRATRKAVKRAGRKDRPVEIARTVRIRTPARRYVSGRPPSGEARDYSHAFDRRGHFAWYPLGTRMADTLAATAPERLVMHQQKGPCRKVWHPPAVVGADGQRPYVPSKTRLVVGDPHA